MQGKFPACRYFCALFLQEQPRDVVDNDADGVGHQNLPDEAHGGPFGAVHLPPDRAHRREARCAQQVKDEEAIRAQLRELGLRLRETDKEAAKPAENAQA